ncbi:DEAD/DEAH box helicase [Streptococcus ruminantium]|uniref:DEAD/DEAH box helicase n=1 Tax=Streptococcus ruminantium TaxID=1917441 RepID=UPI0012DD741B|nr:DEAD/DEAH box helicase family protein [Streptococcus ruminantium]
MMELKDFQKNVVDKLLSFTAPEYGVNELVIKSPTGSGKTITLLSWIDSYIASTHDNVAFVWFTPGAGELEEQSQDKAKLFSSIKAQSVDDALLHGFDKGTVTFINYERVIGRNSKAMLNDMERDNLVDKIEKAFQQDRHFILIIDEAHRNDTNKARDVIAHFRASKTVKVSATIEDPKSDLVEFYEVSEEAVIESGLITKSVVVNEGLEDVLETSLELSEEFAVLFETAENKRQEIVKNYAEHHIDGVNPLVIVQLPDNSPKDSDLVDRVEKYIQNHLKKTYENGRLGVWLADRKQNYLDVQRLDNEVEYLIIKQAIATGWDAPRAKILIKLRENMGEAFTIQTIGRIRRMPEPQRGHYGVDVLDNAYLYTFDSDFLAGALAQGGAVASTPLLPLKDKAKSFRLTSERVEDFDTVQNEQLIMKNLYQGLIEEWGLTDNVAENYNIVENQGLQLGSSITNTYKQGRFDTLSHSDRLKDLTRKVEADYRGNRIDLLHAFHELDRVIHLPVSKVEAILKRFFIDDKKCPKEKILRLTENEWTAFIMNNWRELREVFRKVDVQKAISLPLEAVEKKEFKIPETERYTYNPKIEGQEVVTNAYSGYTTSSISVRPSMVERLFERYLEEHSDQIEFVYKNGDRGPQYFSLTYGTNGGYSHFYPDFIIKMKNGDVYIIETKGGESPTGEDKNIDPYAPSKYEALKDYANRYGIKWAFVRDKAEKLYFLNSHNWIDDMNDKVWNPVGDLFDF